MQAVISSFYIVIILVLFSSASFAASIDIQQLPSNAIGEYFAIYPEEDERLVVADIQALILKQKGQYYAEPHLNFGLWSKPIWLVTTLHNNHQQPMVKRLTLSTSWIDEFDVYLVKNDEIFAQYQLGDQYPYHQREIDSRYFSLDLTVPVGESQLIIRVASPDPLALPIYLQNIHAQQTMALAESYRYGFVYGSIIVLMLYNLLLALSLKSRDNLYYSVYMLAFLLMNFSYSGHSYQLFWTESAEMQKWGNPIFMLLFNVAGLLFARSFLNLANTLPRINKWLTPIIFGVASALVLGIAIDNHTFVIFLAFLAMLIFTFTMMALGIAAYLNKIKAAEYFLIATIMGVGGALITCLTVWGIIEYSPYAYMAIDFGMIVEATLLSLALANKFNQAEEDKLIAQKMANLDPLTDLCNRRAFYKVALQYFQQNHQQPVPISIIMFDLDNFKPINDTYGHKVGDEVLKSVSEALKNQARKVDLIARWGGEEFIALLPETDLQTACAIAERYKLAINSLVITQDDIGISASIGVAASDTQSESVEQIISLADDKLYQAKAQGKNCIVF
mgnify:CR=1 FL=1